jgi:hypothetical protein
MPWLEPPDTFCSFRVSGGYRFVVFVDTSPG